MFISHIHSRRAWLLQNFMASNLRTSLGLDFVKLNVNVMSDTKCDLKQGWIAQIVYTRVASCQDPKSSHIYLSFCSAINTMPS